MTLYMLPAAVVLAMAVLPSQVPQTAKDEPALPYENAGACPYECCKYDSTWQVSAIVATRTARDRQAPVAFRLRPGERFTAVTGVVITTNAPQAKVLRPDWINAWDPVDKKDLKFTGTVGDTLYLLTAHGEGWYTVWFKGRVIRVDLGGLDGYVELGTNRRIETEWWAQLRNRSGRTGWALIDRTFKTPTCG